MMQTATTRTTANLDLCECCEDLAIFFCVKLRWMHATLLSGAQLQERSEEEQGLFEVVWTAQVADAIGVANKTASYVTA